MPVAILSVAMCVNTCSDKLLLLSYHFAAVETEAWRGYATHSAMMVVELAPNCADWLYALACLVLYFLFSVIIDLPDSLFSPSVK